MMIMGGWIPAGGGWNPKLGLSAASEASDGNLGDQMTDTSQRTHLLVKVRVFDTCLPFIFYKVEIFYGVYVDVLFLSIFQDFQVDF